MTMTLIETITVGSGGAASIEFTGIPQDGKDLVLKTSIRCTSSESVDEARIYFNNASSGYSSIYLNGNGSSASATTSEGSTSGSAGIYVFQNSSTSTSDTFSNLSLLISNYTSTTDKSISTDSVTEQNGSTAYQRLIASSFSSSSAINKLEISTYDGALAEHSTASLYTIS